MPVDPLLDVFEDMDSNEEQQQKETLNNEPLHLVKNDTKQDTKSKQRFNYVQLCKDRDL